MGGQNDANLTRDDATMCRNIEVFEVDTTNTFDARGALLPMGSIGLRCIHCIGDTHSAPGNANFPRCVAEIGDYLRGIAEEHLWCCGRAPNAVKQILGEALATRQVAKREGGQAWLMQENNRRLLLDYTAYMARELRLVDKYPTNTGVVMQADVSPRRQTQQPQSVARVAGARQNPITTPDRSRQVGIASLAPGTPVAAPAATSPNASQPGQIAYGMTAGHRGIAQFNPRQQRQESGYQFAPSSHQQQVQPMTSGNITEPNTFDAPIHFPFVREPAGIWVCKFCQTLDPQQRDPYFQWNAPNKLPPPAQFIDRHLNLCRMYQQSLMREYHAPGYQQTASQPFSYPQSFPKQDPIGPPARVDASQQPPSAEFDSAQLQFQTSLEATRDSPPRRDLNADTPENRAMSHLDTNNLSSKYSDGTQVPDHLVLVTGDDRLLLSDYYFYVMKQLRHCNFAESDRRTRGGKRDNIAIGFGGFQCVHCAKHPNSRKFFWSGVDRLANSFAEIPRHILGQCRAIPSETKDALETLKRTHQDQMSRLPRGSQKVYFRRMWRRIHGSDSEMQAPRPELETPTQPNSAPASEPTRPERLDPFTTEKLGSAIDSPATQNSEESVLVVERAPAEAAKALADSVSQAGPPSPQSRVLLAIANDREWLSDNDMFIRQQVEVFCATLQDVQVARSENKHPIEEGTVGLRCVHCALSKSTSTESSTVYPFSIGGIFEAVQEFHRVHLDNCKSVPQAVRSKLAAMKGYSSLTSVSRNWYIQAAKSLGLVDTKNGIRATGESAQLSLFSLSDGNLGQVAASSLGGQAESPTLTPRKRLSSHPSLASFERQAPSYAFEDLGGARERTSSRLKAEGSPSSTGGDSLRQQRETTQKSAGS